MRRVVLSGSTPLLGAVIISIVLVGCAPAPLDLSFADDRDLRDLTRAEQDTYCIEVATWVDANSDRDTYLQFRCTYDALQITSIPNDCMDARARCLNNPPDYLHVEICALPAPDCTPSTTRFFEQCITESVRAWRGRAADLSCALAGQFGVINEVLRRYPTPSCEPLRCTAGP